MTFTIVITNTELDVTGGLLVDSLPTGIHFVGPITDGEYTPGTQVAEFTITSIITGETDGGFPGGEPDGNRPVQPGSPRPVVSQNERAD